LLFPGFHVAILAVALLFVESAAIAGRGITPEDYYGFRFISDPTISPNGKQIAFVVETVNEHLNRRNSSVWMVAVDGRFAPRQITAVGFNSRLPRWSPDGSSLAFLSSRPGSQSDTSILAGAARPQIFLLRMDGGEAHPVSHLPNGVSAFQWAPDGQRLAALSRTGASDQTTGSRKSDVRHYQRILFYSNETGWYDDRRSHIFIIDSASGQHTRLTSGDEWNDSDPQWSPDGSKIAFVSDRTGHEFDGSHNKDIWVISKEGGALTKISDHEFEDDQPRWSPDGKRIAFAGRVNRREYPRLYIAPSEGGQSAIASRALDVVPVNLRWGPGRDELRFEAENQGELHIFQIDWSGQNISSLPTGKRAVHAFEVNERAGVMTYLANDFRQLDELYVARLDGSNERRLTSLNASLFSGFELAGVERFPYKANDGWPVEGFLMKPIGWQAEKKYPMILSIHGGPGGQYGVEWNHEFQVYAARGYAVFFCNPRGSTGYGEKFQRGILNNWGIMDYQDIMAGVEAVVKSNPWVDQNRLGITGGSYGGYLTNWIVGHTDRFHAAVTLRGITDFISNDGTRDLSYGHEGDFRGFLFDEFDQYWSASPLKYAKNVKTPILVLHADNDYRVPLGQAEEWFRALKHYGVTAELVIFPRENHDLTRTGEPRHLVESLNWQLYWFDRFLNGNGSAQPPDVL
jgi:dipeptidyl aminopeptidase/acylaminoacyl peptidase